jgi:ligand-binding sensor domain-containing protein/tRNA A-37 threonylcarbamoyl transferase component Bud32
LNFPLTSIIIGYMNLHAAKYKRCYLSFIFLFFLEAASVSPETLNTNIHFKRFSIEEGLLQFRINCILQDTKGFMWFGTNDGLNKYDGYIFYTYKHEPGTADTLSSQGVYCLIEDRLNPGILWIGTDNGLNRFDTGTGKFSVFRGNPGNSDNFENFIWCIYQDRSGNMWIGTDSGLYKFNPAAGTFKYYFPGNRESEPIYTICESAGGILWLGSIAGLSHFDPASGVWRRYPLKEQTAVWSIYIEPSGIAWFGSSRGLIQYNPGNETFAYYIHEDKKNSLSNNQVKSIIPDGKGGLWVGTGNGLNKFDPKTGSFIVFKHDPQHPGSLSSNLILSVYVDRSGVIWVGSLDGGLNKLESGSEIFNHLFYNPQDANSLSSNLVSSIFEDPTGILWIGTFGGGVNKYDRGSKTFIHYLYRPGKPGSLNGNYITAITGDRQGMIWIGTFDKGVNVLDPKKEAFKYYEHDPTSIRSLSHNVISFIFVDSSGVIWIGTNGGGVNRFHPQNETFTHFRHDPRSKNSLDSDRASSICEGHQGNLWIGTHGTSAASGTSGGLNQWDRRTGTFNHFYLPFQVSDTSTYYQVIDIHEDRSRILWIGSDNGLFRFDPLSGVFRVYRQEHGLPSNKISGILEDDSGSLWISTANGLSRLNPQTGEFKNFDFRDGLQHNDFIPRAYCKGRNGDLIFGGIRGLNIFQPESVTGNLVPPPVVITAFKKFNQEVKTGKSISDLEELKLSYKDYSFSFEFTALDFHIPEKNIYAYRMEGFDRDWILTDYKKREAYYSNLTPGKYTFRVKASNNSGVWNEKGVSLKIIIAPPLWGTWWFRLISLFLFSFISYLIIHFTRKYFTLITFWKRKQFIGHYKISHTLGAGGMGTVYKAKDIAGESKVVALKVIREEFAQDNVLRKRLLREAAIIDQLAHPHVVKIIERGECGNRLFIAMEFLEGKLLSDYIKSEIRLPVDQSVEIMMQLMEAVDWIHEQGVLHRDLKPENVMLVQQEGTKNFVKLLDFGLAKTESLARLTQSGILIGTINYLSPEYVKGRDFSKASDVYALGVIFYEMITGEQPFKGETTLEIMKKIIGKAPKEPREYCAEISPELNQLIMDMMAKKPDERPCLKDAIQRMSSHSLS